MNLRWPTAREVSGPWLHCLAMGKPTVVIDLAHLSSVPTLDPRTWRRNGAGPHESDPEPVAVALDILDEDHSLRLALRRLGSDADLRARLSGAARRYWLANHAIALMVDDYRRLIEEARRLPSPSTTLPDHLTAVGARTLERELERFGVAAPFATSDRAQGDAPPLR
jgi:hypothetical protein